jgi:hypothetical protein
MKNYIIEEIIEAIFEKDKYLTIKFKIGGDPNNGYREIEDGEFYYFCEENYLNDYQSDYRDDYYEDEENDYLDVNFDYDKWMNYYNDNDTIINYIYDNYPRISDLPDFFKN